MVNLRSNRNRALALAAVLAACFVAIPAGAEASRGAVLKVDEGRAYVDLGTEAGVGPGSLVTLFHVITVKHPVSGKLVRDSFPFGKLRVIESGARISVAVVPDTLADRIAVGDEVELASEPRVVIDPWTVSRAARDSGAGGSADLHARAQARRRRAEIRAAEKQIAATAAVEAVWQHTLGQPPQQRVAIWRGFLSANPKSPYAASIGRAIGELDQMITAAKERGGSTVGERRARRQIAKLSRLSSRSGGRGPLLYSPPRRVDEGVPLDFAFLVTLPDTVRSAWLYFRPAGQTTFKRLELASGGDAYLVGTVSSELVRPPGLEYFVEVLFADGDRPRPAIGSNGRPLRVEVEAAPDPLPVDSRGRSRVSVFLDYVDFDGLSAGRDKDQYVHGEIDFMYRFRKSWIYSLRLGFGTMDGVGGPKDVIDDDPEGCLDAGGQFRCRDVSYNYAYTELEWHLGDFIGLMLRPQWGSAFRDSEPEEGVNREFFDAFGLRARLRLGKEEASNLILGVAATQELGKLFEAVFAWAVVPEFPAVLSVQVTDQPVIEDFGVRLIADIGWRRYDWMYPSLRLAYQARDIDHAGPSAGLAINFNW